MNPPERGLAVRRRNTGFMGILHGRTAVAASHEPVLSLDLNLDLSLPVANWTEIGSREPCSSNGTGRFP
jgi:hypothetical protein